MLYACLSLGQSATSYPHKHFKADLHALHHFSLHIQTSLHHSHKEEFCIAVLHSHLCDHDLFSLLGKAIFLPCTFPNSLEIIGEDSLCTWKDSSFVSQLVWTLHDNKKGAIICSFGDRFRLSFLSTLSIALEADNRSKNL